MTANDNGKAEAANANGKRTGKKSWLEVEAIAHGAELSLLDHADKWSANADSTSEARKSWSLTSEIVVEVLEAFESYGRATADAVKKQAALVAVFGEVMARRAELDAELVGATEKEIDAAVLSDEVIQGLHSRVSEVDAVALAAVEHQSEVAQEVVSIYENVLYLALALESLAEMLRSWPEES